MKSHDADAIATALGVVLPEAYRDFLLSSRDFDAIDDTTVLDDPEMIVEATMDYRRGFAGLPPWPAHYVYVGDEADACPYVLDCASGGVFKSHKGRLAEPIERYADFSEFVAAKRASPLKNNVAIEDSWRHRIRYYLPLMVGLLFFFVVLPAIGMALKFAYRVLFE